MRTRPRPKGGKDAGHTGFSGTKTTAWGSIENLCRKIDRSVVLLAGLCVLFFFLFLYLNQLTPYIADDYSYMLSYDDGSRIHSLSDVARSMYAHCFTANGRLIPHTLEQIFLLLPKMIFNICNAGAFVLLMYLAYRIANFGNPRSAALFIIISAAFICVVPAFGQIALWQVGSVNYLWGLLAGVILIAPYIAVYEKEAEPFPKVRDRILFCTAAFFIGWYTEVTSFVCIILCVLILLRCMIIGIVKRITWLDLPPVFAAAGYTCLLLMPAELKSKKGSFAWDDLTDNFFRATNMLWEHLWPVILVWIIFMTAAFALRIQRKRRILSEMFAISALLANYMLIAAAYYPQRCMCTSALLFVLASAVLLPDFQRKIHRTVIPVCSILLIIALGVRLSEGIPDLCRTYDLFCEREDVIEAVKEQTPSDLLLPVIRSDNSFSPYWEITDLDTQSSSVWPNTSIAKYYKVDSILGKK